MTERLFKQKNVIIALVTAILGGLLIFYGTTELSLSELASSIGSILLISGIYSIIESYYLKKSLIDMIIDKVKLDKNIDDKGILEIGSKLSNIKYDELFTNAKEHIDIVHIYARTWTTNNFDFIKDTVMNKNCDLRIVLINPNSEFVPALEKHFGYPSGKLKELIEEVSEQWKTLFIDVYTKEKYLTDRRLRNRKSYKNKEYGSVELYYYNGQPTNSIYRVDDKIVIVESKTSKAKSSSLPYIIYKDNGLDNCMYELYTKEIECIIREAEKFDLESIWRE